MCPEYLSTRRAELAGAVLAHLELTVTALALSLLVSVPLALVVRRHPRGRVIVLGASSIIYTIPSLALFSLLLPFLGLTATNVVVGLTLYSLVILVRGVLVGLDAVPGEVVDVAKGMGMAPSRMLWTVEMPLALPPMFASLRVATVSTVALTTLGTIVSHGGLGNLINTGVSSNFHAQVLTASVLCVVIAVLLDLVVVGVQRVLSPWSRRRPQSAPRRAGRLSRRLRTLVRPGSVA